jgi:hypothetical protein
MLASVTSTAVKLTRSCSRRIAVPKAFAPRDRYNSRSAGVSRSRAAVVGGWLSHPLALVGEQGGAVHEHGPGMRERLPQPVQDREPVGVEVAPVDQVEASQPAQRFNDPHRVPAPEGHDRVRREWEREVGDLVLDDIDARDSRRRGRELLHADGQRGRTLRAAIHGGGPPTLAAERDGPPGLGDGYGSRSLPHLTTVIVPALSGCALPGA